LFIAFALILNFIKQDIFDANNILELEKVLREKALLIDDYDFFCEIFEYGKEKDWKHAFSLNDGDSLRQNFISLDRIRQSEELEQKKNYEKYSSAAPVPLNELGQPIPGYEKIVPSQNNQSQLGKMQPNPSLSGQPQPGNFQSSISQSAQPHLNQMQPVGSNPTSNSESRPMIGSQPGTQPQMPGTKVSAGNVPFAPNTAQYQNP